MKTVNTKNLVLTGNVVANYENNGYDDSDFFAVVFNPEDKQFYSVCIGSTRYAGGQYHHDIDAPENVKELYKEFQNNRRKEYDTLYKRSKLFSFGSGSTVEVIKGRKYPKGSRYEVIRAYKDNYDRFNLNLLIGHDLNGKGIYISSKNCGIVKEIDGKETVLTENDEEIFRSLNKNYCYSVNG
jgi:hypothetical protein